MNETGTPSRRLTNPSLFENENDQRSQRSARSQKTKRLIVSRKTSFCWRVKLATFLSGAVDEVVYQILIGSSQKIRELKVFVD